jgi:hypothetical protein
MVGEIQFCGVLDSNDDSVLFDSFNRAFLVGLPDGRSFDMGRLPKLIGGLGSCPVSG